MQTPWLQRLTRRPAVNVLHWIIPKGTLWKNTLASDVILRGGSNRDVTVVSVAVRHFLSHKAKVNRRLYSTQDVIAAHSLLQVDR